MYEGIIDHIRRFPDHRKHGVRHRFGSIVLLTLLGYMCGRDSLAGVYRFGKTLTKPQLKRLGFKNGKIPCHAALCNSFHEADAVGLCDHLSEFIVRDHPEQVIHISINGKRLRGSRVGEHAGVHVISAFCKELATVLGSVEMGETNEYKAALELLDKLDLRGKIITGDAMFANKDVCHKITEKGGDYMIAVKDNQKPLKDYMEQEFELEKKD